MKWAIALTASLGAILEVIDTSIVNVALTDIQATLGATITEIGWVVTGYAIDNVILIPLSAWLGDVFGKKAYFVFSMIGFTIAIEDGVEVARVVSGYRNLSTLFTEDNG